MERIVASSTSNSDVSTRLSGRQWGRTYLQVILVVITVLTGWEVFWRAQGFRPKLHDSYKLWRQAHVQMARSGENAIAFLGASRIMQAVDLPTVRAQFPHLKPAQLGISGSDPLPILRFLAEHTEFRGTAVVDITPWVAFAPVTKKRRVDRWVERIAADQQSAAKLDRALFLDWDAALTQWLQNWFVLVSGEVTPKHVLTKLLKREWPTPTFWWVTPERTQMMDYTGVDIPRFRESRARIPETMKRIDPAQVTELGQEFARYVKQIRSRGGEVVFVRTSTLGAVRDSENRYYPRTSYWTRLVDAAVGHAIHFEDYPQLQGYRSTDHAHIDPDEAPRFTEALLTILKEQSLIR